MRDGKSNDLEHVAFIIGKCVEREGRWNKGGRNIYNFREWDELKKKGGGGGDDWIISRYRYSPFLLHLSE